MILLHSGFLRLSWEIYITLFPILFFWRSCRTVVPQHDRQQISLTNKQASKQINFLQLSERAKSYVPHVCKGWWKSYINHHSWDSQKMIVTELGIKWKHHWIMLIFWQIHPCSFISNVIEVVCYSGIILISQKPLPDTHLSKN